MEKLNLQHGKQTANDYPYGFRLRCTMTTEIEYKKGKGYRIMTQTTNPKAGDKLNKPKYSTYSPFIQLYEDPATGHTKALYFGLNGSESCQYFLNFLRTYKDELNFTPQQSADFWILLINNIRATAEWGKFKQPAEGEALTQLLYLKEIKYKELAALYAKSADIKEILSLDLDFVEIFKRYEDAESGTALKSYRIAS